MISKETKKIKSTERKNDIENEKIALKKIQQCLPAEICDIIRSYIPIKVIIFLDKEFYMENHHLIKKYIMKDQYENYIRDTIRRDNDFVFNYLLEENFEKWLQFKKYIYKVTIFSNYIYFLLEYCIENESDNCKNRINSYLKKAGLCKNQHKKNITKNIRWTN